MLEKDYVKLIFSIFFVLSLELPVLSANKIKADMMEIISQEINIGV